jgi:phosphoenolpyruvate carboxykinase (ATP)
MTDSTNIQHELSNEELISIAIDNNEGVIAKNGALTTETGSRTGRSPNDRFIVKEETTENSIDWGEINKPFDKDKFKPLWNKVKSYLDSKDTYVSRYMLDLIKITISL